VMNQTLIIKNGGSGMATGEKNIILLRKNSQTDNNLFLVHDGSGRLEGYFRLLGILHPGFSIYGIRYEGISGFAPRNITIREIAEKYIPRIKKIQPRGRYFIAGWSVGGNITFEMVNQLEKEKSEAAFCALIDSPPPGYSPNNSEKFTVDTEINFICKFIKNESLTRRLKNSHDLDRFWEMVTSDMEPVDFDKEAFINSYDQDWFNIIPGIERNSPNDLFYPLNIIRTLDNARAFYVPDRVIKTPARLFYAKSAAVSNIENWHNYLKEWHNYCESMITYQIDGNHYSIFEGQNAAAFAGQLNKVLDQVL
jgi:thioesterase domain-containing protein